MTYTVTCHTTGGRRVEKIDAGSHFDAAKAFAAKHLAGSHVCDGRMETGQGPVGYSFAAIGNGQRIYTLDSNLHPIN